MKGNLTRSVAGLTLALAIAVPALTPATAAAQSLKDLEKLITRRQDKKNEWRNIAIAAGALSIIGLLRKDNTLFFIGAAGALYSLDRYEKDRKSQNKLQRTRAAYFQKGSFTRDGHTYKRRLVKKNGKRYYQFVRVS